MQAVLRGKLTSLEDERKLVWQGVWSMDALEPQSFRYTCPCSPRPIRAHDKLVFTGYFTLNGLPCEEMKLEIKLLENNLVKGLGNNRFGAFELEGTFVRSTKMLEVTRTYLPKPAKKPKMNKESLREEIVRPRDPSYLPQAQSLLAELRKRDKQKWFAKPVNPAIPGLETYSRVIQNPMDFSTIQGKLNSKSYTQGFLQVVEDLTLVFTNALTFNPPGSLVHRAAVELKFHLDSRSKYVQGAAERRIRKRTQYTDFLDDEHLLAAATATPKSTRRKQTKQQTGDDVTATTTSAVAADNTGFESFDELEDSDGVFAVDLDDTEHEASPPSLFEFSPKDCSSPFRGLEEGDDV